MTVNARGGWQFHKMVVAAMQCACQSIQQKIDRVEWIDRDLARMVDEARQRMMGLPHLGPLPKEVYRKTMRQKAELVATLPGDIENARRLKQIIEETPPAERCGCAIRFEEKQWGLFTYPWIYSWALNDN